MLTQYTTAELLNYLAKGLVEEFDSRIVYQGGYVLTKTLPEFSLPTMDIDCTIEDEALYPAIRGALLDMCYQLRRDGAITKFHIKDVCMPDNPGGVDLLRSDYQIAGVDVGLRSHYSGVYSISTDVGVMQVYNTERMLADKFLDVVSGRRPTHAKDLYDLYVLMQYCHYELAMVYEYMLIRSQVSYSYLKQCVQKVDLQLYEIQYNKLHSAVPFRVAYERMLALVESLRKFSR